VQETDGSDARGVALFDLDQTLLPWDMQLLFCNWVLRREPLRRFYLLLFLPVLPLAPLLGSERMKRVFLSFLWRMSRGRLAAHVDGFVAHYVPAGFYGEILAEAAAERGRGRRLVLVSASPEFYVVPVGAALGFDLALGTRVEFGERFPLLPRFPGGNNKHAAKVRRLHRELGITPGATHPDSAGYSDSIADQPMLQLCEDVTVIHPDSGLQALAGEHGWRTLRPPRPFGTRRAFRWRCLKQALGLDAP